MTYWFLANESLVQLALTTIILGYSVQVALRSGVFSLAGIGFYGIGGYAAGNLVLAGSSGPVAILGAMVVCLPVAVLLAFILGRLRSLYLAMSTVAFDLIVTAIALNWTSVTGGAAGLFGIPVAASTLSVGLIAAAVTAYLAWRERGARGRAEEVMRLDESLALSLGTNVRRRRMSAFVLSSMLGGLAGTQDALLFNTMLPDKLGFSVIISTLTLVVIGGSFRWPGVIIGAVIVTWLPEVLRFGGQWRDVIYGVIVVAMILYAPEGFVGLAAEARRRLRRRRVPVAADAAPKSRPLEGAVHD